MKDGQGFESPFFEVVPLVDGVFATIEKKGAEAGSNAGIVDLGSSAVVFDSFLNLDAARDLLRACMTLTGKVPSFLINSHFHLDHVVGNQVFEEAIVVSSKETRTSLEREKEALNGRPYRERRVRELEALLETVVDERERENVKNSLKFSRALSRPDVSLRLPNATFEGEITLFGTSRKLRVVCKGMGHSPGDVVALLPEEKICFAGDLLFKDSHPWLGSGDPLRLCATLRELTGFGLACIVPGHGGLAENEDLLLQVQYIEEIMRLVCDTIGEEGRKLSPTDLSPVFHGWESLCFEWNVEFLKGWLGKGEEKP